MLTEAFSHMKPVKVLVVGDLLLDVYTKGVVERISPEAPVPVLLVSEVTKSPGGAGNVALNLRALGAEVTLIGRIGEDDEGLRELLSDEGIQIGGLFVQEQFRTPIKNRFLAGGQQLMRTDYEEVTLLDKELEERVIQYVMSCLDNFDIVAISDYGKGFLSKKLLSVILSHGVRVIVDPKGKDFTKYNGAYLIKPNNKEAYAAALLEAHASIEEVAEKILNKIDTEHLLITRSDKGMSLFSKGKEEGFHFSAQKKEVIDVTGAGDTALSMITFSLANGLSFAHAIELANIASSIAIEQVGCAAVRLSEVAKRLLEREPLNKIFWEDTNLFVLERAIDDSPVMVLDLREYQDISSEVYHLIKEAAERKNGMKLAIHVSNNQNFIHLLASMYEIDFIFARESLPDLIEPAYIS